MWKISEVNPNTAQVIQLCQSPEGRRTIRLRNPAVEPSHPDAVFETNAVPSEVLRSRDIFRISEEVELKKGGKIEFDAHGTWFTEEEMDALDDEWDFDEIPWCTAVPPLIAPR